MTEDFSHNKKMKPNLDILAEYEELLEDYDHILRISNKTLGEINKKLDEDVLLPLLEEKLKIADKISGASKRISRVELAGQSGQSPAQMEIIRQARSIIAQIKNRAELLLKCENEIEDTLRSKGLKIR